MSCDHELANEWARCSGKNASFITIGHIAVGPRSARDIEILFKLIVKVPVIGNTADTPNPPGLLPF